MNLWSLAANWLTQRHAARRVGATHQSTTVGCTHHAAKLANRQAQSRRCLSLLLSAPLLSALLFCSPAHAFDLDQLSAQLSQPAVIRGPLIQEKHLRALPKPLTSRGEFVLSGEYGLLWQLHSPLKQDYRIDRNGIFKRDGNGWQQQPGQDIAAQQSRLFLAVLKGDHSGLGADFTLSLSGDAGHWQLQLSPKSLLLKQIFSAINIQGGALVEQIELLETQGDRTVLRLPASTVGNDLSPQERADFAQ